MFFCFFLCFILSSQNRTYFTMIKLGHHRRGLDLQLHVHHTLFVHFSAVPTQLQLKNWNDKGINLFTISPWTRTRSPLFSSNLTHVPYTFNSLSDLVWGRKSFNGREVYFSATFSMASLFSDSKVPIGLFAHCSLVLVPSLNTSASKLWFETNRQGIAGPKTAACDTWHNPLSKAVLPTNIKIYILKKWSCARLYSVTFPPKLNHLTDKPFKLFLYVSFEKSIRQWVNGRV